ncbi:MAG TPA: thiamine phosphate synthase [Pyrinomonadaceae bacterium]|nr:thiamine phosphate synthase [Pyrinomonadaceae bacterium]
MPLNLQTPIIYLITSGETTQTASPASEGFARLLALVASAVAARVQLIQLREKNLQARALYELTTRAAQITRGSATRLLVNDRADVARAAGADGVHLTTRSLEAHVVRRAFPRDFLIGVSTHSLDEARAARDGGADFVTFGPVFETPSKREYGPPLGLEKLGEAARSLSPFPLIALGGITRENAPDVLGAGASGVAAIRLFGDSRNLDAAVRTIRNHASSLQRCS